MNRVVYTVKNSGWGVCSADVGRNVEVLEVEKRGDIQIVAFTDTLITPEHSKRNSPFWVDVRTFIREEDITEESITEKIQEMSDEVNKPNALNINKLAAMLEKAHG